ncbi:MAG: hypothetical protein ACM3N0_06470, partial [Chloroflexota bacterium]
MRIARNAALALIAIAAGALLLAVLTNGSSAGKAPRWIQALSVPRAAKNEKAKSSSNRVGHKGLGPNTPVPKWAKGRAIHFAPMNTHVWAAEEREAAEEAGATSSHYRLYGPLRYDGGPVQHRPHVFVDFWGHGWIYHSALKEHVLDFYRSLNNSSYSGILTQYFDTSGAIGNETDLSSYSDTREGILEKDGETEIVGYEDVEAEVHYAINHQPGWGSPNSGDQYVIVPAPEYETYFPGEFCAFHEWDPAYNTTWTLLPYPDEEFASCPYFYGASFDWQEMQILASHEWAESATDPRAGYQGNLGWEGWLPNWREEQEIGDNCYGTSPDEIASGIWAQKIQDNFKNSAIGNTCTTSDPSPARFSATVTSPVIDEATHSAELRSSINPAGYPGGYQFEFRRPGGQTTFAPYPAGPLDEDSFSAINHGAKVESLKGETTYAVKLSATSEITTSLYTGYSIPWNSETSFTTPDWRPAINVEPIEGLETGAPTFHASIDPNGYDTKYHFEWGQTTNYEGGLVPYPDKSVGSGTSAVPVSGETLNWQFLPRTVYHYRVVATNQEGTTYSPDNTFITPGVPHPRIDQIEVGKTSAVVKGAVNPEGSKTTYYLDVRKINETSTPGIVTPVKSLPTGESYVPFSEEVKGLSLNTHYLVFLFAKNAIQEEYVSQDLYTPDPPPVVSTGEASEVTGYGATLSGTINPEELATEYSFQYGISIPGMSHSETKKLSAGTESVGVSQTIRGLSPSTTYYYRLTATNPAGSHGEYESFTTTDGKPKVTVESPSGVKSGQATLNAKVLTNGYGSYCWIEWGPTTSYGNATYHELVGGEPGESPVSQTILGLKSQTTYHYRFVVENAYGTDTSADQTLTTPNWLPAIGYQTQVGVTAGEATLTAGINPDSFATHYRFEWGPTASYGNSVPASDAEIGSGESEVEAAQTISGLKPATKYHFRTVATNAEGTTYGSDQTFVTGALQHWFACKEQTGGRYNNSKCATETVSKTWESLKLAEGEKSTIAAVANPIVFSGTSSGVEIVLSCETEVTGASLEN